MLPPFVYDLIAAVQRYEQEHGEASMCFDGVLYAVPAEEQHAARVLAAYKLAHERPAPSPMQADIAPDTATSDGEVPRPTRCRCSLTPVIDPESLRIAVYRNLQDAIAYNLRWRLKAVNAFRFNPADFERLGNVDMSTWVGDLTVIETAAAVPTGWLRVVDTEGRHRDTALTMLPTEA